MLWSLTRSPNTCLAVTTSLHPRTQADETAMEVYLMVGMGLWKPAGQQWNIIPEAK
jgi:hypothetical protein